MTRYTVVWHSDAEENLARFWLQATDRGAITSAANEIDRQLRTDAEFVGETVVGEARQLVVSPLAVLFRVREDDCVVQIAFVKLILQ